MRPIVQGIAALLAITLAFPASAGLGPNGLGPNGLGPNGLGPNGLGPNGLGPNGLGPNGLGPNGLGPNGLGPNGLGPNGLGPNGLGPNGLGPNGLEVNGLGPNGLGPNGLVYLITPAGVQLTYDSTGGATGVARDSSGNLIPVPTYFGAWFATDSVAASHYMNYFARCAYDTSTAIAWVDTTGRTHTWSGQYGLGMASLKAGALEPLGTCETTGADPGQVSPTCSQQIRARMTPDEGKWVSACILAHVNTQGTHQYISLRGNPPNPEAQAALALSTGELWTMSDYHGAFFGDLFVEGTWTPKVSCVQHGDASEAATLDIVLGRSCDSGHCPWLNADGSGNGIVHFGRCANIPHRAGEVMNPLYTAADFAGAAAGAPIYHPIFVNGPIVSQLDFPPLPGWSSYRHGSFHVNPIPGQPLLPGGAPGVDGAADSGIITPATSVPFDLDPVDWRLGPSQSIPCKTSGGCAGSYHGNYIAAEEGWKLVGIRAGQVVEGVVRYTGHVANNSSSAINVDMQNPVPVKFPETPDYAQAFTAVIRYSNCRTTPASAAIAVSDPSGLGKPLGSEIWPSTIPDGATACANGENFTWLQVYPVYGFVDYSGATFGDRPTLKLSISGATQGESCTGAKLLKGDGETGACALKSVYFDWKRLKVMCRESGESKPVCRGDLVFDYRGGKWGWFCAYGGKAILACTGADAPDLDAFAFIPGKPYCMPDGATAFAGICK